MRVIHDMDEYDLSDLVVCLRRQRGEIDENDGKHDELVIKVTNTGMISETEYLADIKFQLLRNSEEEINRLNGIYDDNSFMVASQLRYNDMM